MLKSRGMGRAYLQKGSPKIFDQLEHKVPYPHGQSVLRELKKKQNDPDFELRKRKVLPPIQKFAKGGMPSRNKKNFRPTKSGAGMTRAGVMAYRRLNPGSKLQTAVTGKVKPGSKAANRRKSFCARSAGQMKQFPSAAKDPNSRLRQARRRWKC